MLYSSQWDEIEALQPELVESVIQSILRRRLRIPTCRKLAALGRHMGGV